jgi:hypothetical protein
MLQRWLAVCGSTRDVEHQGGSMHASHHTSENLVRELAYRETDGVEVSLLWNRANDSLTVYVLDLRTEDAFELAVEASKALEVFHHPYAYAASRGIHYGAASRPAPALA